MFKFGNIIYNFIINFLILGLLFKLFNFIKFLFKFFIKKILNVNNVVNKELVNILNKIVIVVSNDNWININIIVIKMLFIG